MRPEQGSRPGQAITPPDVVVSPVVVFSQTFAARPSSLPDAHAFVRSALSSADVAEPPHAEITRAINAALLAAASPLIGSFAVVVRLFPDECEIEVLSTGDPAVIEPALPAPVADSFAAWLAEVLQREGLSREAAAHQLGVSVRTVSRWMRGQTEPRLRDIRRINEVFGPVPQR